MRTPFLAFAIVAAIAALTFGTGAFNFANTGSRDASITIVQDDGAYLSVQLMDSNYNCHFSYTGGKVTLTFGSDATCSGAGSSTGGGINAGSQYYYYNLLKITNKGTKAWGAVFLNTTATPATSVKTNLTYFSSPTMDDTSAYNQVAQFTGPIPTGTGIVYVGFLLDATGKTTSDSWSATFTIGAKV